MTDSCSVNMIMKSTHLASLRQLSKGGSCPWSHRKAALELKRTRVTDEEGERLG